MKILHIVTYISPDGAFGGPVRVALNQAKALTELGHEVVVAGSAGGFKNSLPNNYDGFPVKLFPARRLMPKAGFAGLASPRMLLWLTRAIKGVDVVHVHLARDLVTLPAAAMAILLRKPLVVQAHGMIDETDKILAKPLDLLLTRPVLRRAGRILYLTHGENLDLIAVAGSKLRLTLLPNGVAVPEQQATEQLDGPQERAEVLYLARLHAIKRPTLVVKAAQSLHSAHPQAHFTLIGPDEGEGETVKSAAQCMDNGGNLRWVGPMAPDKTNQRMQKASIFVLPSSAEVFPMSVLEAMSMGLPVVVTDGCGLASEIEDSSSGIVCDQSSDAFIDAVAHLLRNPKLRIEMGANARNVVINNHSIQRVGQRLAETYDAVRASPKARP